MKFNTKIRYAIRAMVEIAKADENTKVFQKDIVKKQKISPKYLDQIIQSLKSSGLVYSLKGRKNGYRLVKDASEITILDIHNAFESEIAVVECLSDCIHCELEAKCPTRKFWYGLNTMIIDYFKNATLRDLMDKKSDDILESLYD